MRPAPPTIYWSSATSTPTPTSCPGPTGSPSRPPPDSAHQPHCSSYGKKSSQHAPATGSAPGTLPFVVRVLAAGSALAGMALDSSLGLTGPALVGAVFAALTLLPLIALALSGTGHRTRIVAQRVTAAPVRDDASTPAHH